MPYSVRLTQEAADDLSRLLDFVIARELESTTIDLGAAERALQAIQDGFATLQRTPFTCRKAGASPFLRELVIAFGASGFVALFEIVDNSHVVIAAVRHKREDDYH